MSAEVLREAAALMRERATAAPLPPGPWEKEFSDVIRTDVPFGAHGYMIAETVGMREAEHIASWHPAVALAVADWLDSYAKRLEVLGHAIGSNHGQALAVATAYLGDAQATS